MNKSRQERGGLGEKDSTRERGENERIKVTHKNQQASQATIPYVSSYETFYFVRSGSFTAHQALSVAHNC